MIKNCEKFANDDKKYKFNKMVAQKTLFKSNQL